MTSEDWKQKIKGMGYVVHDGISAISVAFLNKKGNRELIVWHKSSAKVDRTGFGGYGDKGDKKFKKHPIYEPWKNMINAYMDEHGYKCQRII